MKNIDKMKESIIEQIRKMDLDEFKDFNYVMLGGEGVPDGLIDTSELFDCNLCRKYFRCSGNDGDFDECSANYEKYALSETER